MASDICSGDHISRCIIYARAFDGDVHVDDNLWPFGQSKADGAAHESGVLRRLAPSDEEVHRIGCKIAANQNRGRNEPPPGPERRYYCGFRTAACDSIPLTGDGYYVVLSLIPEDGEKSHVDVALFVTVNGKNARATRRTDAGLALAEAFGPAIDHICACDVIDEHHPINKFGVQCLHGIDRDTTLTGTS